MLHIHIFFTLLKYGHILRIIKTFIKNMVQKIECESRQFGGLIPRVLLEAIKFDKTYAKIPIVESNERVVEIESIFQANSNVVFNNELTSSGKNRTYILREGLIQPLLSVAKELNTLGYQLRFEYVYRSLEDQERMFRQSVVDTITKYPTFSRQQTLDYAGIFIANTPDTAAHVSGAAVDVTLLTLDGRQVNLGANYLDSGPESATNCQTISRQARINRRFLVQIMEKNGFANYPYEFWHFCQGDKIEARIHNKNQAIYGPLDIDLTTNQGRPVANASTPFNVDDLF